MTIFVDDVRLKRKNDRYGSILSHMWTDADVAELTAFAAAILIPAASLHGHHEAKRPFFYITQTEKIQAIRAGAVEVRKAAA